MQARSDRNTTSAIRRPQRNANERDAFSHSAQCDAEFSKFDDVPGGAPHPSICQCWCHVKEFDKDAEPEYDAGHESRNDYSASDEAQSAHSEI